MRYGWQPHQAGYLYEPDEPDEPLVPLEPEEPLVEPGALPVDPEEPEVPAPLLPDMPLLPEEPEEPLLPDDPDMPLLVAPVWSDPAVRRSHPVTSTAPSKPSAKIALEVFVNWFIFFRSFQKS
jgi:hypothetical protein